MAISIAIIIIANAPASSLMLESDTDTETNDKDTRIIIIANAHASSRSLVLKARLGQMGRRAGKHEVRGRARDHGRGGVGLPGSLPFGTIKQLERRSGTRHRLSHTEAGVAQSNRVVIIVRQCFALIAAVATEDTATQATVMTPVGEAEGHLAQHAPQCFGIG